MRISDWSADVCSSDLRVLGIGALAAPAELDDDHLAILRYMRRQRLEIAGVAREPGHAQDRRRILAAFGPGIDARVQPDAVVRSEAHTSELQSLMRISYAVFCLKNKKIE